MVISWSVRWRLRWWWWASSWPFRWAHKPLCQRFRRDVIRLGQLYLCRSCALVYLGAALGGTAGLLLPEEYCGEALSGLLPVGCGIFLMSYPGIYRRWSRRLRDGLRFGLGAVMAGGLVLLGQRSFIWGFIFLVFSGISWFVFGRMRGRYKKQVCAGCPDLRAAQVCPGYALQAERARAYERKASEAVMAGGWRPGRGAWNVIK